MLVTIVAIHIRTLRVYLWYSSSTNVFNSQFVIVFFSSSALFVSPSSRSSLSSPPCSFANSRTQNRNWWPGRRLISVQISLLLWRLLSPNMYIYLNCCCDITSKKERKCDSSFGKTEKLIFFFFSSSFSRQRWSWSICEPASTTHCTDLCVCVCVCARLLIHMISADNLKHAEYNWWNDYGDDEYE